MGPRMLISCEQECCCCCDPLNTLSHGEPRNKRTTTVVSQVMIVKLLAISDREMKVSRPRVAATAPSHLSHGDW